MKFYLLIAQLYTKDVTRLNRARYFAHRTISPIGGGVHIIYYDGFFYEPEVVSGLPCTYFIWTTYNMGNQNVLRSTAQSARS